MVRASVLIYCFSLLPSSSTSFSGKRLLTSTKAFVARTSMTTSKLTEAELLLTNKDGPKLPPISASKRIFYVRHGEVIPPGGAHGVFYGCLDVPLSPLGELEAKAAGMFLQQYNVDKIASSPLKRAMFGANQVLKYQNSYEKDIEIYQGFTELDRGEWCGRTKAEIGPDLMARFDNCDETITPKG